MKPFITSLKKVIIAITILCFLFNIDAGGRAGGGGGHSSSSSRSSSSSSRSSSSSSSSRNYNDNNSSSNSSNGSGSYSSSGGSISTGFVLIFCAIIFIPIIYFIYAVYWNNDILRNKRVAYTNPRIPFPEGLGGEKIRNSFLAIQQAWQDRDLTNVRKWISDGVYQRFTAQFEIMNKLSQTNELSNIIIDDVNLAKKGVDGNYETADIAIRFSMDDSFKSEKYPVFNESFSGDTDLEYWTFIKRTDAPKDKDLYNNDSCPNCGAPFDTKMGEISRCVGCGTLTNNASYDWILSEITQGDDYNNAEKLAQKNDILRGLTKDDELFSIQRIEDVASNVFMQIMEVFNGGDAKKLTRFADKTTVANLLEQKATLNNLVFDRLYLNDVTLNDFTTADEKLNLLFDLTVTYRRVDIANKIKFVDDDFVTHNATMILSKNLTALKTPAKETVYSYECPNCGAPYSDTTNDACTYCDAPVSDSSNSWVLTNFECL